MFSVTSCYTVNGTETAFEISTVSRAWIALLDRSITFALLILGPVIIADAVH
jgi:hypothetical protein